MREQEAVEIELEQSAKRVAQAGPNRRGVITHQEVGHERKPAPARACETVGERERTAAAGPDVQRRVVWADRSQLVCGNPRRQLLPESEAVDPRAALELVQASLAATYRAAEGLRIPLTVAEMVAVSKDNLAWRRLPLEPLEPLARHHWIQDDPSGPNVVGVDRHPDLRVDRRPVVHAGEHLTDRPVRYELKHERTQELRPRRAGQLDAVVEVARNAIRFHHRQHVTGVTKAPLESRACEHARVTAAATTRMPPGPALPRLLQTLGFILVPARFIDACRRRYGDVVTFSSLFDSGFVMVFEPELVKQVFRGPPDVLRAGEANAVLGPVVGDRSVLLLDGAEHLRERKLMLPAFHGERMRAYEEVIREAADRSIESWPVGEPFTLLARMQSLTLDVILRAVFGVGAGPRQEELKARIRALLDPVSRVGVLVLALSGGRFGAGAGRRFEESRRVLDELIYQEIARRRAAEDLEEREDVFSMLLLARDEDGRSLTDRELRDELVTLLVAGHETTATALAWAFELLLRNPRVLERLRAELAGAGSDYLDAVVKETLRLRPVIMGVGRVVRGEPFELGGYLIPPGVEINPSITTIHRRDDCYPDSRAFGPERFLGPNAPDTYTWLPFGGGTRRCLGASFATFEMQVVIRRVLERTSLAPVGRRPEKGVRRGITFVPSGGVRVRLGAPVVGRSARVGDRGRALNAAAHLAETRTGTA